MAKYADLIAAQSDGLIHYWPMEETSGAAIADVMGGWDADCFASGGLTATEYSATAVTTPAGHGRDLSANWDGTYAGRTKIAAIRLSQAAQNPTLSAVTVRLRYFRRTNIYDTYNVMAMSLLYLGRDTPNYLYLDISGNYLYFGAGGADNSFQSVQDPFVDGQWHDIVLTCDATSTDLYVNGTLLHSIAGASTFQIYDSTQSTNSSLIAATDVNDGGDVYDIDSVIDGIIQDTAIWNRKFTSQEVADLNTAGTAEPLVTDASPVTYDATLDATLPIEALFSVQVNPALAYLDANFPIDVRVSAYQDWVSKLPPVQVQEVYRLVITGSRDGLDDLYLGGISSWQATDQAEGRASYVQAVIPAADQYLAEISARQRGELVIQKGYRLANGQTQYDEVMRSGFDALRPDRGQRALTITVSGYMRNKPLSSGERTLSGVRSISTTNGKRRVRCAIDLFLKPGMTVTALNETFIASYINYYVSQTDKFCEVSER